MAGPKFRVAICGGGIGGLTLALTLARYPDISVTIYEAAKDFTEIGAGIGLWPRALSVFQNLGLRDDIVNLAGGLDPNAPAHVFHYRKSDQPDGASFYDLVTPGGLLRLHRAAVQQLLLARLPSSCSAHTSKRLLSYTQHPSSVFLRFTDGSTASCDLLVGADGLHSAVRVGLVHELRVRGVVGSEQVAEPRWSGEVAYRALIPMENIRKRYPGHRCLTTPTQFLGRDNYILAYPISNGTLLNFVAFTTRPEREGTKFDGAWMAVAGGHCDDWKKPYEGWDTEVQQLFDCAPPPMRWAIHTAPQLPTWVSGRVTILGDAAHAMTPHEGSGAGQAIEDAYLLGTLLGHPHATRTTLPAALAAYDRVRRPFAESVQRKSRENGRLFTCRRHDLHGADVDEGVLRDLGERIRVNWKWAWETSVDGDVGRAVEMFERA
ncbi:FAD/NAD(P)-binding domain-containing protein [Heliocybe sulcata]|uniref:FAD/NAD(P)-binding domain-containing protein n=1 Tax=Heliocybe sulcata TaxID=5364 RepID=A0A5C3MW10_9AGAM|nr:FAD/NAD(P)-binding domain-containing protein [Heliocybe sulcata]